MRSLLALVVLFQRVPSPAGCQKGGQKQKPVETEEGQRPVGAELSKQFGVCGVAPGQGEKEGKRNPDKSDPVP